MSSSRPPQTSWSSHLSDILYARRPASTIRGVMPTQLIRSGCLSLAAFILCGVTHLTAQSTWQTRTTNHFEIYYERQSADRVDGVTAEAERAYSRISGDLRFDLPARVPLIVVPSESDLPKNREAATALVRESGAPDRDHLVLALEPAASRQAMLTHELTHHFTWELTP